MITVITGPMKCGKSEEILKLIKRYKIAERNVVVFKPDIDNRFADDKVVSRDSNKVDCTVIPSENPEYIYSFIDSFTDVIVIDEAQFFAAQVQASVTSCWHTTKETITKVVQSLSDKGHEVIVAGLDMTSDREPFNNMGDLMAIAHTVIKLKAVCEFCKKEEAIYTVALFDKKEDIVVGDKGYTVACPTCWIKHQKNKDT